MLSWFPQCGARVLPSNSRVRRWRTRHSREGGTTPPSTRERRTLREHYSTVSTSIRGRKVPPRRASSSCEGREPACSLCGMRAVRHLTHLRCWVVPGRDSSSSAGSVRRVPSLHSAVSLRLGHTRPLFLHTSAGVNPARSVPGVQDTAVPAVGAACTHQYQEIGGHPVSTPSAGGVVPGFASSGVPSFQQVIRPGSGPGGRLSPHSVGLCRGLGA